MVESHQIIVLSTLKFADDKIIVNALSRSAGRVTLLVRIAHSQRAAVRHTLFQPLAILDVEWEATPRSTMFKPKTARPALQLLSLMTDPTKTTVAMFLAEFLLHATRNEDGNELLYDYIVHALQWFDTANDNYANFHLVFLLRLSRFLGIAPNIERSQDSGIQSKHRPTGDALPYFDMQEGTFCGTRPDHSYYIYAREAAVLPLLVRLNFGTMHLFRASGAERSRILNLIITYYRLHLPGIPELKSLEVLKAVFR